MQAFIIIATEKPPEEILALLRVHTSSAVFPRHKGTCSQCEAEIFMTDPNCCPACGGVVVTKGPNQTAGERQPPDYYHKK